MARKNQKKAAQRAIERLFAFAKTYPKYAQSAIRQARKISTHYKVSFSGEQKAVYSKRSNTYLHPSHTRVRVHRGKVIRTDMVSRTFRRIPLGKRRRQDTP